MNYMSSIVACDGNAATNLKAKRFPEPLKIAENYVIYQHHIRKRAWQAIAWTPKLMSKNGARVSNHIEH